MLGRSLNGRYRPPVRRPPSRCSISWQNVVCSGVMRAMSAAVKIARASGGVLTGNGCVGHGSSPLVNPSCGTGRSSTP